MVHCPNPMCGDELIEIPDGRHVCLMCKGILSMPREPQIPPNRRISEQRFRPVVIFNRTQLDRFSTRPAVQFASGCMLMLFVVLAYSAVFMATMGGFRQLNMPQPIVLHGFESPDFKLQILDESVGDGVNTHTIHEVMYQTDLDDWDAEHWDFIIPAN